MAPSSSMARPLSVLGKNELDQQKSSANIYCEAAISRISEAMMVPEFVSVAFCVEVNARHLEMVHPFLSTSMPYHIAVNRPKLSTRAPETF